MTLAFQYLQLNIRRVLAVFVSALVAHEHFRFLLGFLRYFPSQLFLRRVNPFYAPKGPFDHFPFQALL